jgi:nucleoside-diphosphate-sugar epimerase
MTMGKSVEIDVARRDARSVSAAMSRVLVTAGSSLVGSRVIRRLLGAGGEVRTIVENHEAGRFDAVAGSEFVDDRIRLRE